VSRSIFLCTPSGSAFLLAGMRVARSEGSQVAMVERARQSYQTEEILK
jgi:hypothetical protein